MPGLSKPVAASGSLRVLAVLVGYPDPRMRGHLPEMHDVLRREGALSRDRQAELHALIDALALADPLEAEANYVELFDRGRGTSLHLFEHVHGDSRERGSAMIDLAQTTNNLTVALLAVLATLALADDRMQITQYEQMLSDAITNGTPAAWGKYLDPDVIYAEEDDSYKGKSGMIKEVRPLSQGLGGEIKVELLSYHEDGDTAVALFRQHEIERYYGQTIHASYLLSTVWKKRDEGWRQIEGQVLAEKTDPPSIVLPVGDLQKFKGTYQLKDSEPTYTITLTDGKLMGGRTGKAPSVWDAETRDVFFIKGDPRIRKIFQYDATGRVTGFIERRESWDIVWNKLG